MVDEETKNSTASADNAGSSSFSSYRAVNIRGNVVGLNLASYIFETTFKERPPSMQLGGLDRGNDNRISRRRAGGRQDVVTALQLQS